MNILLRPGHARPAFFGLAALLLLLITALAMAFGNVLVLAGALACGLILLATVHQLLVQAEARASACEQSEAGSREELQKIRASQDSRSTDLALLGRYGNLLLACTDLAEALQISEQMLSLLLPDCAGTIISQDYNYIANPNGCTLIGATAHNITVSVPATGRSRVSR